MALSSAYLVTSRHHIFYFRIRVPVVLQTILNCSEIKRSLKTRCRREAVIRSASLLHQVQRIFSQAEQGKVTALTGLTWKPIEANDTATPPAIKKPRKPRSKQPKLSKLLEEYLFQQKLEGVSEKTLREKRSVAQLLIEIIGDKPVDRYGREEANNFRETALKLPPRYNLGAGRLNLQQLIERATSTISLTTYNNYIKNLITIFSYAETLGKIDKNPFRGMKLKQRIKPSQQRARFTHDDLRLIFSTPIHTQKQFRHPYQYWLPLMGLFTGARLNELSQLYLEDFKIVDGIKCIHFQANNPNQRLKTPSAERIVPIHQQLLSAGLWEFVETVKGRGEDRLFPELKFHKTNGYANYATKWFIKLRKEIGLTGGGEKKDFHSFRHTVADELKQQGFAENLVAGLLGHQSGGITYGRYGKDYKVEALLPVVRSISLDVLMSH